MDTIIDKMRTILTTDLWIQGKRHLKHSYYYHDICTTSTSERVFKELIKLLFDFFGKDYLKQFFQIEDFTFDYTDWKKNILLTIFAQNIYIGPQDILILLESFKNTAPDTKYLLKDDRFISIKDKWIFGLGSNSFNMLKKLMQTKIKKVEEAELKKLINHQKNIQWDDMIYKGKEYLEY